MVAGVNGRTWIPVQYPPVERMEGQRLDLECVSMMNQPAKDNPVILTKHKQNQIFAIR